MSWSGRTRAPLERQAVHPTVEGGRIRAWIGVGGSRESIIRAARYRLPLMLAIIGGASVRFAPFVHLYQRVLEETEGPVLPVGVHSPGHIADTDEEALTELEPHWMAMRNRIGAERGWGPASPAEYRQGASPDGALYVGSPETVARKIAATVGALGLSRFDLKYSAGTLPHEAMMRSIELYGTKVIPMVRDLLA